MPSLVAMAEAGWEPVPYAQARVEPEGKIRVERFGPKGDELYFSLRNEGHKQTKVRLTIDTQTLGIPAIKEATRLPESEVLRVQPDGTIELEVPAATATVLRVR
jgi:hypothetical protein